MRLSYLTVCGKRFLFRYKRKFLTGPYKSGTLVSDQWNYLPLKDDHDLCTPLTDASSLKMVEFTEDQKAYMEQMRASVLTNDDPRREIVIGGECSPMEKIEHG